jgi:hypothetical protein
MANHKSGELLSALLLFAASVSTLTSPADSKMLLALNAAGAMPEWAIISAVCSIICLLTSVTNSAKTYALSKFVSGCAWGSILLVLGVEGSLLPLFWISIVLFSFDIFTVLSGGNSWSRKNLL